MKKMLVALLLVVLAVSAYAGPYTWDEAVICGYSKGTNDTTFVNAPLYYLVYGVEASANGRVYSSSYYGSARYRAAVMVWDHEFGIMDTIGPEIIGADGVADTLGSTRFMASLANGNVAIGDWTNDKIRVFDQEDYSCVQQSPGTDLNCGGGIGAFAYDGEQYFLSQQIVGSTLILWDNDFNVVDTLTGGPGGRNMTCNEDGSIIISPSLGKDYLIEWAGNPDDGWVTDTIWLADFDVEIGNAMYVDFGPDGYLWIMSRDAANDGILVVDVEDDYALRSYTNTDSTVTPTEGFPLGLYMDNQALVWLSQGLLDSSEVFTPLNYNQPQQMRAPNQIVEIEDATAEYLYVSDYYGYTLKRFTRPIETSTWHHTGYIGENGFNLNIAYPNPFNPSVTIPYDLSTDGLVAINVYDVAGKKVATLVNENKFAGSYEVHFDASDLSSGNYLVKMTFENRTISQKVTLLK